MRRKWMMLLCTAALMLMPCHMDAQGVRDASNRQVGKVESNGSVRNSNNSYLGKVDANGTVRDSNNRVMGYAKGVPTRYVAVFFFFHFF